MAPRKRPILDRFWEKVVVGGEDDCWLWAATINTDGYARFGLADNKNVVVHRFAYELLVGPIPEGLTLDHLCRVRHCVNPRHLEPVTSVENVMRGESRSARNARKTHCLRGHEFTEENTYRDIYNGKPRRRCRECARHRDRLRRRKR